MHENASWMLFRKEKAKAFVLAYSAVGDCICGSGALSPSSRAQDLMHE